MFIDYTETRELVGSGNSEIEVDVAAADRNLKSVGSEVVSISGQGREYQLDRIEYVHSIRTVPLPLADLPRWREFAASVANGETFSIDIFGTAASPDDVKTVSMIRNSYQEARLGSLYMVFSFRVVER